MRSKFLYGRAERGREIRERRGRRGQGRKDGEVKNEREIKRNGEKVKM